MARVQALHDDTILEALDEWAADSGQPSLEQSLHNSVRFCRQFGEGLRELCCQNEEVVPKQGQWQVLYLGFARGGWTPAATDFAREFAQSKETGGNWQVAGVRLLDLNQVDADLIRWTDTE